MKIEYCFVILFVINYACYVNAECCYQESINFQINNQDYKECSQFDGFNRFRPHGFRCPDRIVCGINVCGDGKPANGHFCGVRKCNAFGCDCDGGCLKGDGKTEFKILHGNNIKLCEEF